MTKKKSIFQSFGSEYFKVISTMLTSAFGLVAALAWNEVIKKSIERYISPGSGLVSQLIYAIIITTVLVILTIEMGKISERINREEENSNDK